MLLKDRIAVKGTIDHADIWFEGSGNPKDEHKIVMVELFAKDGLLLLGVGKCNKTQVERVLPRGQVSE